MVALIPNEKKPYLKNYFGQHKKRWVIVREQYWHPAQMEPSFHQLVERKIWSWFAYPVKYLDPILLKDSSVDLRQKFYWEILGQNIWNSKIQHKFMLNFFYRIGLVFCHQHSFLCNTDGAFKLAKLYRCFQSNLMKGRRSISSQVSKRFEPRPF